MKTGSLFLVLLATVCLSAEPREHEMRGARHLVLVPQHVLSDAERASLAADGIEIQRALPGGRYLARVAPDAAIADNDPRVRSLTAVSADSKIDRSARRMAARGLAFGRFTVLFHDQVTLDAAQDAIEAAGGVLDQPLTLAFGPLRSLTVQLPTAALTPFVGDERVMVVYGALPHVEVTQNASAAKLSKVDVVQAAPYGLTGKGVILSMFEFIPIDKTHKEFEGRVSVEFDCSDDPACLFPGNGDHPTHVAGTMIAKGIDPLAKGMAPAATLEMFRAGSGNPNWLTDKETALKASGAVADNNSWGRIKGWCSSPCPSKTGWTWLEGDDLVGGYDGTLSAPLDHAALNNETLMVHGAGNEAEMTGPKAAPFTHNHANAGGHATDDVYCYSQDGSGTDCPNITSFGLKVCSSNVAFCEKEHHAIHAPYGSSNWGSSGKNIVSVGATDDNGVIAAFSSRGPTRDGRVKPDLTAKGFSLYSTTSNNTYGLFYGTSMSSPVVTGTMALFTEQWRKTTNNPEGRPNPVMLKALALAGADDKGIAGPDVTYGYGFLNAKNSIDLIIADEGVGKRIKSGSAAQGSQFDYPMTVAAKQDIRVLLSWFDPEAVPVGTTDATTSVLINDLDLKIVGPDGSTTLPYMLVQNDPCYGNTGVACKPAVRQVNTVDNNEEVEIKGAAAGTYHVIVSGTRVMQGPQAFVVVGNGTFAPNAPPCTDPTEPNETAAAAYGPLTLNRGVSAVLCSDTDVDNFRFTTNGLGSIDVTISGSDSPMTVTVSGPGVTTATKNLAPGDGVVTTTTTTASPSSVNVEVKANGARGATGAYTISVSFPFQASARRRGVSH